MEKQLIQQRKEEILSLVKPFCVQKLNEEYYGLAEKLMNKLGRKKNVPFVSGQPETWAAAVIHALGSINFLFDKASVPYSTVDEINNYFGTNKSTTSTKSKHIKDLLKIGPFDHEFSTKVVNENNPFNDLVVVNGLIVPIDSLPLEIQEQVHQARAEGHDISFATH